MAHLPKYLPALLLLANVGALAAEDVTGARDPLELKRFPHAWIIDYQRDDEVLPREFVVSRVDKTRRDVRVESSVRTEARLESATYQMPSGTNREDVAAHYVRLLGSETLFACEGFDCGRSNHWANYIFKQAILFGPDKNQSYVAVDRGGDLVAVYVVERGNKRVYAHVLVLKPETPVVLADNHKVSDQLARRGHVVIDGLTPPVNGNLSEQARTMLRKLGEQLRTLAGRQVYVVCHLYGPAGTADLLAAADRCSIAAAQALAADGGPELMSFGAGPLLPRSNGPGSRIELILPDRLPQR